MRDPSDAEDIAEVERFLSGDERGFDALFDKYRKKVYHVAFRFLRNKEDSLEVTQDVFLRVFRNLSKFQTNSKFFTWLYRITVNRAIDFSRSRRARPAQAFDKQALEAFEGSNTGRSRTPGPVAQAQAHELEEKVAAAVALLSEKHRAVFLLHAQENLSYKEIAEVLECSMGTVMSRLFYARKKLQEHLVQLGVEVPRPAAKKPAAGTAGEGGDTGGSTVD